MKYLTIFALLVAGIYPAQTTHDAEQKIAPANPAEQSSQFGRKIQSLPPGLVVFLNGKEIPYADLNSLDTSVIQSVNVLKGDSAVRKYGEKGRNGVIEVNTKKELETFKKADGVPAMAN